VEVINRNNLTGISPRVYLVPKKATSAANVDIKSRRQARDSTEVNFPKRAVCARSRALGVSVASGEADERQKKIHKKDAKGGALEHVSKKYVLKRAQAFPKEYSRCPEAIVCHARSYFAAHGPGRAAAWLKKVTSNGQLEGRLWPQGPSGLIASRADFR
jgi:hypothetical protein